VPATGLSLTPDQRFADRAPALARRVGQRVGLDGLLSDLGRAARVAVDGHYPDAPALHWDAQDAHDRTWWPQGITTDAESSTGPASVVIAAWYAKGLAGRLPNVAARVSVLSLADARYDHVLLVDPRRAWLDPRRPHRHVPLHAGGLVWVGDLLLVADTRRGMRAFDLRDVTALDRPVAGCRFLLPERGRWVASTSGPTHRLRWSFAAVDASAPDAPQLLAGEYAREGTPRLVRLPLAPLLAGRPAEAVEVVAAGVRSMQGVARVDETYWVSASRGEATRGRLWHGTAGTTFERIDDALPAGCEDLSYDAAGDRLWTQSEYPGQRLVIAVPLPRA
jgi:hypothetical protein